MSTALSDEQMRSLRNVTTLIYALYALSLLGFGITAIVAIVLDYIKRDDAQGTWLESHFRWQIRTFWFGLLWASLGAITLIIVIGWIILGITCVWFIYRIAKGWLYLNDARTMYGA
jgi:uncharacterized membrane protein